MYVTSSFAQQIARIEKYGGELKHGNLEAERDFTDVRDVVRAYVMALEKCEPGVYNICSDKKCSIEKVLAILRGFANCEIKSVLDSSRMRPSDVPLLVGNCDKFKQATGWEPTIPFEKTMSDLLNYWREIV
jgi:GDP-4-dehydro-6-deoxy-D-mannose reductase